MSALENSNARNLSLDRRGMTKAERLIESPEYRKERLRDLTGIADEQRLFDIYYELKESLLGVGLDNLKYRRNTVDGRKNTEFEFAIKNLDGETLERVETVLGELKIVGFPEPVEGSNHTDLVIEYKRDLEVLRLMSVFKDLDKEKQNRELIKRIDEETDRIQAQAEAHAEEMRRLDIARMEGLRDEERLEAEQRLNRDTELAKQKRVAELEEKWLARNTHEGARKSEERIKTDAMIDEVLARITPQEVELDFHVKDLKDPFEEVTKFGGYQERVPEEKKPRRSSSSLENVRHFLAEVDPQELDERMEEYAQLWESGEIIDFEHEPLTLPGGRVNLDIFPKKFIWKFDQAARKTRCYEFDAATKQVGKEVTREERQEYMLRLKDLRRARFDAEKEKGGEIKKTHEETDLEQKVLLTLNNLIVWVIRDLTTQMRGNTELRMVKANDADDLYQNGVIGAFYAIDNHDPSKAVSGKMIPYVIACMEGYIRRLHHDEVGMALGKRHIRLPEHLNKIRREVQRIERLVRNQFPAESDEHLMNLRLVKVLSDPEVKLLREGSDVRALEILKERLMIDYEEVAYDILENDAEDPDTQFKRLSELLRVEPEQHESVEREHLKHAMTEALNTLTPREERVLRMRFFPQGGDVDARQGSLNQQELDGMTFEEVGKHFSVTRERIRQIELKALRKLKHPSRLRMLPKLES